MSFSFKSFSVTVHDVEEPEFGDVNDIVPFAKGDNMVYKILHSFIKQGNNRFINIATNAVRRATNHRLSSESTTEFGEVDKDEKRQGSERMSRPFLSGLAYCFSSCSMILLNKVVLSSYGFDAGTSLMFYQNFVCVMVIMALEFFGAVSTEKFSWKLIKIWIPVNLIFIGMLVTGMYSLKYINIAMVTILKNMTNILTAIGEAYIFRRRQNKKVWTALFLMIISAVSGGFTDLSFDALGYAWQTVNCILTASYSGCYYDANVLGGCNSQWITWTSYQLHLYVVFEPNRSHHLQSCGILE